MNNKNLYTANENGLYTTRQALDIINSETKATGTESEINLEWIYVQIRGRTVSTKCTKANGESKRYKYKILGLNEGVDYKKIYGRFQITAKGIARMLAVRREQLTLRSHESRRSAVFRRLN